MIMVCGINCNIQNSNRKISKIILYFVWVFIIIFIGPQMKDFWNILPSDSLYSMIDAITSPASTSLVDQSVSNTSGCPTFPHCVFSYVCSKNLDQSMQNHTDCICLAFLQCASSNVSSTCLPQRMQNHTGCICLTFLHCAFSNASSNDWFWRLQSHTGCICYFFLYGFSNETSTHLDQRMHSRIGYICLTFLHCVFSNGLR